MSDANRDDIAKLEALYAENPEGRIFTHLAEAYRKAGALDQAQQVLTDGIERHPNYSSAHVVLGRVLMEQDRVEEAEAEFRRVLDLDGQNLIAIRALGDLARGRGADQEALTFYQRLLDQEPSDEEVRDFVRELSGAPVAQEPPVADASSVGDVADAPSVGDVTDEVAPLEDSAAGEPEWAPFELDPAPGDEPTAAEAADEPVAPGGWVGGVPDEEPVSGETADETEVRTETIAQVYARQGLYDRAAEVYRQLVSAHPQDERLRERLAEMEQLAAARESSDVDGEVGAVSDFGETDAGPEPDTLEGFESMEVDTVAAEATPLEGLTVNESDPETGLRADTTPETASPEEDLTEELAVRDVPEPPEETPWEESVWTGEDWETEDAEPTTPHAWTADEDEDTSDTSEPIRAYFGELLEWGGGTGAAAPPARGVATEGGVPEPTGAEPAITDAAGGESGSASGEGDPAGVSEEDDDLEMFRSWLESLKQ